MQRPSTFCTESIQCINGCCAIAAERLEVCHMHSALRPANGQGRLDSINAGADLGILVGGGLTFATPIIYLQHLFSKFHYQLGSPCGGGKPLNPPPPGSTSAMSAALGSLPSDGMPIPHCHIYQIQRHSASTISHQPNSVEALATCMKCDTAGFNENKCY